MSTSTTTKAVNINQFERQLGEQIQIPTRTYASTVATTNTSTSITWVSGPQFSADMNGNAVTGAGIPNGATFTFVDATHGTLSAAATATSAGVAVVLNGTSNTLAGSTKTITSTVPQALLDATVAAYVFVAEGEPVVEENAQELLTGMEGRVAAVLAGTDTFSSSDIQKILAALIRNTGSRNA